MARSSSTSVDEVDKPLSHARVASETAIAKANKIMLAMSGVIAFFACRGSMMVVMGKISEYYL